MVAELLWGLTVAARLFEYFTRGGACVDGPADLLGGTSRTRQACVSLLCLGLALRMDRIAISTSLEAACRID